MKKTMLLYAVSLSVLSTAYAKKESNLQQMITFLQDYIHINTAQPNPNYKPAIEFLTRHAQDHGFESRVIKLSENRDAVIITLRGSDPTLPALALNHHMDTVPLITSAAQTFDPLGATLEDDHIYGIGTQDMKGVGVVQYWALLKLKQTIGTPRRTIHLIGVPDEEIGGFSGAGKLVETQEFKDLNIKYLLDESIPSGDEKSICINVAERKVLHIELESVGKMGHASDFSIPNAVNNLIQFLSQLVSIHNEQKQHIPHTMPGKLLSQNVTSINCSKKANEGINVIPDRATATVDIRIPATRTVKSVQNFVDELIEKYHGISYTIKACISDDIISQSDTHSKFFKTIKSVVSSLGYNPIEHHAQGASDMRFYLTNGIESFGLSPFTIKANLHGANECIRICDLELGLEVYYEILKKMCT